MRQLLAILGAAAVVALVAAGLAGALSGSVPAPPANPTSADQIQNIDQVKTAIKGVLRRHAHDPARPGRQLGRRRGQRAAPVLADGRLRERDGRASSRTPRSTWTTRPEVGTGRSSPARKAILFDIDDTTLNTYSYEIYSNFVFNPTTNAAFVNAGYRRACSRPCRAWSSLEHAASRRGLHGVLPHRPPRDASVPARVANLTDAGYDVDDRPTCTSRTHRPVASRGSRLHADAARRLSTSRSPGSTSSRSATTSSPTSATSSAT